MKKVLFGMIMVLAMSTIVWGQKVDSSPVAMTPMTAMESARIMSSLAGISDLDFPAAPGAIAVISQPDDQGAKRITFILDGPFPGGQILFRMVLPDGRPVPLKGTSLGSMSADNYATFDLWKAEFSFWWPDGITRIEAYVITGENTFTPSNTNISRVSASVLLGSWCCTDDPGIESVWATDNNTIKVAFSERLPELPKVLIGIRPATAYFGPFGELRVLSPATLIPGTERTVTVCVRGECRTRTFSVPNPRGRG